MKSAAFWVISSILVFGPVVVLAQPANIWQFKDCFSGNDTARALKLNVSTVYAQILDGGNDNRHLNLTVIGESGQTIIGQLGDKLATLFTTSEVLTFDVFTNSSSFCTTLRPPVLNQSQYDNVTEYCPIEPGPFALSSYIPLHQQYELVTIDTRLRAVDPSSNEILCVDISTTPLLPGKMGSVYGHAVLIMWCTIALAGAYWITVGLARVVAAWDRGQSRFSRGLWSKVEASGYVLASAISGEGFATSPALMRFCTPSMRDIFFHTQWSAALGMVAVQWPRFTYPLFAQTAWATLTYNTSFTHPSAMHWNPLRVDSFQPPSNFADQLNDPTSVLYVDGTAPNTLFMLPNDTSRGISSFAYSVGVQSQDLFGICLSLFLALAAAVIGISVIIRLLGWLVSIALSPSTSRSGARSPGPRYVSASKDALEVAGGLDDERSSSGHALFRLLPSGGKSWKRRLLRSGPNTFHGSVLHGNLVRLLILFHFPITIFSSYQMTVGRHHASLVSIVLAALSFAILSVILPALLIGRVVSTSTNKLYDETGTLLALGPLYNHYRHGSQLFATVFFATNLAFGLTIGCGQKSGTAQAIIILVLEVASALGTSVWLPWGQGASMGLISFLFCVGRIVIAVLLVILTPVVSIGSDASGWIAYAILFILALIYLTFFLLLFVKLIEAIVRIFGGIGFDRSRHVMDTGLIGACGLLGCCGGRRRRRSSRTRQRPRGSSTDQALHDSFALPTKTTLSRISPPPSLTTSGPPSVLRPEQAFRPYKEDSDDEGGYIMRAWQPFPQPGYTPVEESPPPEPKSGFTRVGGGRAHYDSPYAIQGQSSQSFPRQSVDQLRGPRRTSDSPPPTASLTNVTRHAMPVLPTGTLPHTRKLSQTAIIEDASLLHNLPPHVAEPSSADSDTFDDGNESDATTTPKRTWFGLRKNRRQSDSVPGIRVQEASDEPAPAEAGRSFVVVRKKPVSSSTATGETTPLEAEGSARPSFSVLRSGKGDGRGFGPQ